jgi:hypothetical protein
MIQDNEVLETKVLTIITEHGPIRFGDICALIDGTSSREGNRVRPVDRTIQRLRKRGQIEFVKGKWARTQEMVAVPSKTEPKKDQTDRPLPHQW